MWKIDRLSLTCKKSARRAIECKNFFSFLVKQIFKGSLCRGVQAQSWFKKIRGSPLKFKARSTISKRIAM